jgi:branched-chain amino acid aminotransferase
MNWEKLGFQYIPTNCYLQATFKDGKWGKLAIKKKASITLPVAATCLHYGQACFEGLKAFRCKDGKIRIFRPEENLRRMNNAAEFIHCPQLPDELFIGAIKKAIKGNIEYVPPYGTGGSLYIRPLLIGSGSTIGVNPSDIYDFIVLVTPVGAYYKGGMVPVGSVIFGDYDRSAPRGTGHLKVAGNYAAGLYAGIRAKKMGYPIVLYLDSLTRSFIDEFGTSNFIGIRKDGVYVTPDSRSILPSITNKSLMAIASGMGIKVERRPISVEELSDFSEVGACGTAVVITPIKSIKYNEREWIYPGVENSTLKKLYDALVGIQLGESPDKFNWLTDLNP